MSSLNYPLDYRYPEVFGEIDQEERILICNGALDLVLIENASEILRQVMQKPGIFEYILKSLVKAKGGNIEYIKSETFPFYPTFENKAKFYSEDPVSKRSLKNQYYRAVNNYKKLVDPNKTLVTILAVDLEASGGHYAAFYYKNGTVYIFDSMQTQTTKEDGFDLNIKSLGYYTPYFIQLGSDIFPEAKIVVPDCIKEQLSLQITGGFARTHPLEVVRSNLPEEVKRLLSIQSTESQNHFCYLWAIWWIHLKLSNLSIENVLRIEDPLILIKKYAWCLMTSLGLFSEIDGKYLPFFEKHFLNIWANYPLDDKLSLNFKRYKIPFNKKCKNVLRSLMESYMNPEELIIEKNTPIPRELCL